MDKDIDQYIDEAVSGDGWVKSTQTGAGTEPDYTYQEEELSRRAAATARALGFRDIVAEAGVIHGAGDLIAPNTSAASVNVRSLSKEAKYEYWRGFANALLLALSAPVTEANVQSLIAWMKREGTRATFNPLATTQNMPGATSFNYVHVRNYPDLATGVAGTMKTLRSKYYKNILAALLAGKGIFGSGFEYDFSKWSGGAYTRL